jgi:hypothetical protein
MAKQVIKYRLTAEGTIPDFLYIGEDGVGGVFAVSDPNSVWPRDLVQVGITNDNATGDFEVIPTKADLLTYLTSVGTDWKTPNPLAPGDIENMLPFDASAATNWVWDRFTALGGI